MKKEAKRDDFEPEMPDAGAASYLATYLFDFGPLLLGGGGSCPLTQVEIDKWQSNTGIALNSWEARTITRLSRDYFSESNKATKRDCPAPWTPTNQKVISLTAIDSRNAIRALAEL